MVQKRWKESGWVPERGNQAAIKSNVIIKTLNTIPLFELSDFLNGLISIFLNNLNCPTNQKLKITVDAHLAEKD